MLRCAVHTANYKKLSYHLETENFFSHHVPCYQILMCVVCTTWTLVSGRRFLYQFLVRKTWIACRIHPLAIAIVRCFVGQVHFVLLIQKCYNTEDVFIYRCMYRCCFLCLNVQPVSSPDFVIPVEIDGTIHQVRLLDVAYVITCPPVTRDICWGIRVYLASFCS